MSPRLTDFIEPWACAQAGRRFEGELPLAKLSRLGESLVDTDGAIAVELTCGKGEKKRPHIQGRIRAHLRMECQRCLEPVELVIDQEIDLVAVATAAEAELLPEDLEPLIVEDGRVRLQDLVEDELLLALPLIPRHEGPCGPELDQPAPDSDTDSDKVAANPLAKALAELKRPH